jgi:L-seryl-tRNA(Ser) seleniumtransferase
MEETVSTDAASALKRALRSLPSVAELAGRLEGISHEASVRGARAAIEDARQLIVDGRSPPASLVEVAQEHATGETRDTLLRVVNATGVIVHTNLGRAPLPMAALDAVSLAASGYSNLEYDLKSGKRGSRQAHVEALLIEQLTGGEAALVVNNGAAAVLLASAALARGRDLVVSRGQLIEIGGSFRIPEIVEQSGARLVEVGTTNRTRLDDYRGAIGPETGAILRVHQSNFRSLGFVQDVGVEELTGLGVPVIDDLGSGMLAAQLPVLDEEPTARDSLVAGAAVVCFSGDKLLGGPQAGLMVGERSAIERCRTHPLARAMRIDKLSLAALAATLRLYLDPQAAIEQIPVLAMLTATRETLDSRALALKSGLPDSVRANVIEATAKVGGGALPLTELSGPVCAIDPAPLSLDELARRLRSSTPPVVGRAYQGRLLLDPRTIDESEVADVARAVVAALR